MQAGPPQEALIELDREAPPQSSLNIERGVRANPWARQLQLVEELLVAYAPSGAFVLDPFACLGTTLMERSGRGRRQRS